MKKILTMALLTVAVYACSDSNSSTKGTDTEVAKKTAMDNPDYDKGLNLIAQSDCLGCHKVREASIGPSYADVANKYDNSPANVQLLAQKIINGGVGVWGQVPMSAHADLPKGDAEAMVKYIFLLKD